MNPAAHFLIHSARPLGRPVIPAREERKQRACHQYIMEMRNHIMSAVKPPIVKTKIKPTANSMGVSKLSAPRHIVAIQLKTLTPVGTEISIVAYIKNNSLDTGMPVANIWCAQTINDRIAIAATAYTIEL